MFVYEALLYLKHSMHPRIFNNTLPRAGVVVDDRQKVNVITLFSVDRSKDLESIPET